MAELSIPIFPLPIVAFPSAVTPLHIFEPRYRVMLEHCLSGDHRFGLCHHDSDDRPPEGSVGCVVQITNAERLPDGRSNIITVGEKRYRIIAYLQAPDGYLRARVEPFNDSPDSVPSAEAIQPMRDQFMRVLAMLEELTGQSEQYSSPEADPERLTFQAAAAVVSDTSTRQRLLEITSTDTRMKHLVAVLSDLEQDLSRRLNVRNSAKRNGGGRA